MMVGVFGVAAASMGCGFLSVAACGALGAAASAALALAAPLVVAAVGLAALRIAARRGLPGHGWEA